MNLGIRNILNSNNNNNNNKIIVNKRRGPRSRRKYVIKVGPKEKERKKIDEMNRRDLTYNSLEIIGGSL